MTTAHSLLTGEYGNPKEALHAGDLESVFVFARPDKVTRGGFYEFVWFVKTGFPRMERVLVVLW